MRRMFVAIVALCALAGAAEAQEPSCTQSVAIPNTAAASTVKLVADPTAGSSSRVYVCGYTITAATAAATAQLLGGTGAGCVTASSAALTGVMNIAANGAPITDGASNFRGMATQPGAGLCIVIAGTPTGGVAGVIYYSQK